MLCLGDYIYEHHDYDGPAARADRTGVNHDGDVQTLAEYRQKYRFYQSDPHLQDMHAAYPFISIWDDHEVENNYAGDEPDSAQTNPNLEDGDTPRRVSFPVRRQNGYRAFFEAMPRIQTKRDPQRIYGSIRLGQMAELYLTDSRQYRSEQPCDDVELTACPADQLPGGTMLGATQKAWVKRAVPAGKARWNLLTSETMMMALDSSPGNSVNQDQWDGYAAERHEILTSFVDAKVQNLVVLSGDLHTFIAGNLTTTGDSTGTPVGVEMLGGSATSLGLVEETGISGGDARPATPGGRSAHRLCRLRPPRLLRPGRHPQAGDRPVSLGRHQPPFGQANDAGDVSRSSQEARSCISSEGLAGRLVRWRAPSIDQGEQRVGLALPEAMLHAALDHDCEGALVALASRRVGDHRAGLLGLSDRLLDVLHRDVRPQDRLLMLSQRLADPD